MTRNTHRQLFVRHWRKFRGMSQEELGGRLGMSGGNVSMLERGKINYTRDTLEGLAAALDCTAIDLLARDPYDSEGLWSLWTRAGEKERHLFIEIGKTILAVRDKGGP